MFLRPRWAAILACPLLILALSACDGTDRVAEKQAAEEAVARGEPVAGGQAEDPSTAACKRAGGEWAAGDERCTVTRAMCEGAGTGTWQAGTGCVVAVDGAAECAGFGGMQWSQDRCVLTYLSGQELAQNGL